MLDRGGRRASVAQRAAIGAGWNIAWRMASRNLGLISTLILVRLLQPSDFGLVSLATGLINSVDALSAIGVFDALVRAPALDRDMYDTGFTLNALRNITTAAVIAVAAWPIAGYLGDSRLAVVMLALSLGTLIGSVENIGIIDFRRDLEFQKDFNINLSARATCVLTTVVTASIWHSYWALVIGLLSLRVIRIPLSYRMSRYRPRITLQAWRRIIRFSLWTWAQTMLFQVRERSDSIVIGRLLGTRVVGEFFVGLELGTLPSTELLEPLGRALFSGFASLHNAAEGLGGMFKSAVEAGFMMVLPAAIGISMVADPMVRLVLGEQWLAAVPVIQVVAIGTVGAVFIQPAGALLNAIGRPHVVFYLTAMTTAVKIVALLVLIPGCGLRGAAMALVITGMVEAMLFLSAVLPHLGVPLSQLLACLIRPVVACTVMMAALWWLGMAWTPSIRDTIWDICRDAAWRSAIGSVCYVTALLATWIIAGRPDGPERFILRTLICPGLRRLAHASRIPGSSFIT